MCERGASFLYNMTDHFCLLGTSDFDAQMSGIKTKKGDEILKPVNKKPFPK
jgi:hypothetical protein